MTFGENLSGVAFDLGFRLLHLGRTHLYGFEATEALCVYAETRDPRGVIIALQVERLIKLVVEAHLMLEVEDEQKWLVRRRESLPCQVERCIKGKAHTNSGEYAQLARARTTRAITKANI